MFSRNSFDSRSLANTLKGNFLPSFKVDGEQDGEPDFSPLNKDFQLMGTSQSSSYSIINGQMNSSKTYTLTVAALNKGKVEIPPINFGKDKSPAATITVNEIGYRPRSSGSDPQAATPNGTQTQNDSKLFFITAETDTKNPYVQEQMILTIKVYRRLRWADASLSDPSFEGVETMFQPLGKEKNYETEKDGIRYAVTELRYALFPQESGQLTLKPFVLRAKVASGKKRRRSPGGFNDPFFDDLFSQQTYVTKVARSKAIDINVKPIPAAFTGKQWIIAKDLQLQENWSEDISQLKAGEPVTRTLALIGDGVGAGQLPEIKINDHSQIKSYPDQPVTKEQASAQGLLSTRTQKFALIPSNGGKFKLPIVEIPWWNSQTDTMEIARLPQRTLIAEGITTTALSPVTQQPTPVLPQDASTTSDLPFSLPANSNLWLLGLSGALLILWLITLIAWLRARNNSSPKEEQTEEKETISLKTAIDSLNRACNKQQGTQVRDALLEWANAVWTDNTPRSLEAIAQRVDNDFAEELNKLSSHLYGNPDTQWNADQILQYAKQIKPMGKTASSNNDGLEPLYR